MDQQEGSTDTYIAGGIVRIGLRDEVVADLDSLCGLATAVFLLLPRSGGSGGLRDEKRRGV